jgi:glycerol-3-phosphate dehydrogenase (NAD(P)+)
VAEGVNTCRSVVALAERHGIEMPICRAVHRVLFEDKDPREAVGQLMTRVLRFETE